MLDLARDLVNAPQFAVTITRWNLDPSFDPQMFAFTPAENTRKIDFEPR
jgi:hypothetical protein